MIAFRRTAGTRSLLCLGALALSTGPPSFSAVDHRVPQPLTGHAWVSHQRTPVPALQANPAGVQSLAHIPGAWLLAGFVVIDVGQALSLDWAERRSWQGERNQYVRQTVPVAHSCLAIVTTLAGAFAVGGTAGLRQCFNARLFGNFLPVSLCFALGLSMKMMAVDHFQAGTIKIVGQLRLATSALLSALVLAKIYSLSKWLVLVIITTSCALFVQLKGNSREREGKPWKWSGLAQLISWVLLNSLGGVIAERSYKSRDAPFYAQKVAEDWGHLLTGLVMLLLVIPRFKEKEDIRLRKGGFFDSWDTRTMVVLAFLFLDAWVSNWLLKRFSVVVRGVAKAFAITAVYFVSLLYAKDRRKNRALTPVALLVIMSTALYFAVD